MMRSVYGFGLSFIFSAQVYAGIKAPAQKPLTSLAKASAECGAETEFFIEADPKAVQNRDSWLRTVIRFTYSGEKAYLPNGSEYSFDWSTGVKLPERWVSSLIKSQAFNAWAGPDLIAEMKKLRARRSNIQTMTSNLYGKDAKGFVNQVQPEINLYWATQKKIIHMLGEKYGVTQKTKHADCSAPKQ